MTIQPEKASCFRATLESILHNPEFGIWRAIQCLADRPDIQFFRYGVHPLP